MGSTHRSHTRKPPQQQRSEAMVERIVDAGTRVLLKYGYDGTSTNKIAAEADVSPGSLYYYFTDKDGVVGAVLERFLSELGTVSGSSAALNGPVTRDTFVAACEQVLDVLQRNRRLLDILVNEAPRLVRAESRDHIEQRLRDHMRLGFLLTGSPLSGDELEARTWLAAHLCLAVPVRYVLNDPPISREHLIAGLADQIGALAGVASPIETGR